MSSSAERQRRRRNRRQAGLMRVSFWVDEVAHVEMLIATGYLRSDRSEDRNAINEATRQLNERLAIVDLTLDRHA